MVCFFFSRYVLFSQWIWVFVFSYSMRTYAPEYDEILKNKFCELLDAVKELLMTVPELSSVG